MNKLKQKSILGIAVAILGIGAMALPLGAQQQPQQASPQSSSEGGVVVQGVTKPFVEAHPWFNQAGTIYEVPVVKGQVVKKGDVIIKQDDRIEKAILSEKDAEANSTARIDAAVGDLKIKKAQLERLLSLQKTGGANPFEIEEAQSKVIYGDATVQVETLNRDKAKYEAEAQRVKVEQMTIKSSVDGRVESIDVAVGDVTDPQHPVISIVQNDPLKVQFFIPIAQANKLKVGDDVQVRYPGEENWYPAKLTVKNPLADPASDTQEINLEMKNADNRDSGMQVQVRLPASVGPATPSVPGTASAEQK